MSPKPALRNLAPEEELKFLQEIYGADNTVAIFERVVGSFAVLQHRSQMLLSLVTICLTITGFSGPQIAASSQLSKICIAFGLSFVLLSAVIVLMGPLVLRWGTRKKAESMEKSLVSLIYRRNRRSRWYHIAAVVLVIGLTGYVGSVLAYLFQV